MPGPRWPRWAVSAVCTPVSTGLDKELTDVTLSPGALAGCLGLGRDPGEHFCGPGPHPRASWFPGSCWLWTVVAFWVLRGVASAAMFWPSESTWPGFI